MTRLGRYLGENARKGNPVIIGYLPGPYPNRDRLRDGLERLKAAGIRCVEIGIPDETPPLEGEVIADAMAGLRRAGWDPMKTIDAVGHELEAAGMMGIAVVYPVTAQQFGVSALAERLSKAGFAGIIIPGAAGEIRRQLCSACKAHGTASVAFVPASEIARTSGGNVSERICESDALLYLQTVSGPTGSEFVATEELRARVQWAHTTGGNGSGRRRLPPVALGFGIKDADDARAAFDLGADVVVIGTAMVEAYEAGTEALERYLAQFVPILR